MQKTDDMVEATYIIPHAESVGAFDDLEATMALPGIKILFFAMTDASKALTGSKTPDWHHPKLWEYVDQAVKLGEEYGVMIGANTSYGDTMNEMHARVKRLHEAGVKFILLQPESETIRSLTPEQSREIFEAMGSTQASTHSPCASAHRPRVIFSSRPMFSSRPSQVRKLSTFCPARGPKAMR